VTWHTDEELDRLDAAFMELPEDNDPMILTEFDGFCAGLIICPEMIAPSVWLPEVWGPGGAPEFKDLSEMQAVLDLIMAHYNRVAGLLMMQGEYYPVMDEDRRNGDILWEFWMMGFAAAMRLRPEAWAAIGRSGNARAIKAFKQMENLADIAVGFSEGKRPKAGKLIKQAPNLIPALVEDLNHFAKSQPLGPPSGFPLAANMTTAPVSVPKVGRNDPCSCGSGKKFKKCCGAGGLPVH
jgi:uncharacterized protein